MLVEEVINAIFSYTGFSLIADGLLAVPVIYIACLSIRGLLVRRSERGESEAEKKLFRAIGTRILAHASWPGLWVPVCILLGTVLKLVLSIWSALYLNTTL